MIGISLFTLTPGHVGGSETYARALTAALARSGELEYVCYTARGQSSVAGGLPTIELPDMLGGGRLARLRGVARAALRPPLADTPVVHFPLTVPLPRARGAVVVTLHDLLHRDVADAVPLGQRLFRRIAYDGAARTASAVIVPSEYVRGRAIEVLNIPADRVHAIHHGIDHGRFRPGSESREAFLLYPAQPWPHKNHARLFAAFAAVRRHYPELRLVLTGFGHEQRTLPRGVEALGYVDADRVAALYRRAAALVFPSLHEGFGAPPLEAMASGCPVAAARTTAIPEVCGDAAAYFDPYSIEDIAAGIRQVLDRPTAFVEGGLARAAQFSWEASARAHESIYRRCGSACTSFQATLRSVSRIRRTEP